MHNYDKLAERTGHVELRPLKIEGDAPTKVCQDGEMVSNLEGRAIGVDKDGENTWVEATSSYAIQTLLRREEFVLDYIRPLLTHESEKKRDFVDERMIEVAYWMPYADLEESDPHSEHDDTAEPYEGVRQITGVRGYILRPRDETIELLHKLGVIDSVRPDYISNSGGFFTHVFEG